MLGGGFPAGKSVVVRGPEGSGKSRACLRWASSAIGLVVCLEMDKAQTREVALSAGADPGRLYLVHELGEAEAAASACGARVVLVDSITVAGRGMVRRAKELRDWAGRRGAVVLLISHENKRGQQFGASGLGYGGDVTIRITAKGAGQATVRVLKSRYGPRASAVVSLVG